MALLTAHARKPPRRCVTIIIRLLLGVICTAPWLPLAAQSLYKTAPGPHQVKVAEDIVIADGLRQREVIFRVLYPDTPTSSVIVHSHGGFCLPENYDALTTHWASHGYLVLAPNHPDSPNYPDKIKPEEMAALVPQRLRDLSFVLDVLAEIEKQVGLAPGPDERSIGISGHSFGAGMALMKTGLHMRPEYESAYSQGHDERYTAAVFLSAPGEGPEMAEHAFAGLKTPFLATGGTRDRGRFTLNDITPADFRRQVFMLAPPGDKYSIILKDADHFLGGLICDPDRGGEPDTNAVEIFRSMTTAFFDAYLKSDPTAKSFLIAADINALTKGRADYRIR